MIIQIILTTILVLLTLYFLQNRNSIKLKAGKKVLFTLFIGLAIIAILRPDTMTDLARLVGVGRGVDLLVYGLVMAFIFVVINIYLKFKDYEQRINKLARNIAITEARVRDSDITDKH